MYDTNDVTLVKCDHSCDERIFNYVTRNRVDLVLLLNQEGVSMSDYLKARKLANYEETSKIDSESGAVMFTQKVSFDIEVTNNNKKLENFHYSSPFLSTL